MKMISPPLAGELKGVESGDERRLMTTKTQTNQRES